jgi:predicted nucleic acid-binding protein
MADRVFLDTNGWLALLHAGDARHQEADGVWRDLIRRGYHVVITDWIIAETGNGSARSRDRQRFAEAVKATLGDDRVELIVVDEDLLSRSLEFFARHQDKFWGLVDCASFVVMQERGIAHAFTSVHDFDQAGFRCLLSA